jgi:hypothetical protein
MDEVLAEELAVFPGMEEVSVCPVERFCKDFEKSLGRKSKFVSHLTQSHIEVLKAFRSLVDERLEHLDHKTSARSKKKTTSIQVD